MRSLGQNPFAPIKTEDHLLVTLYFLGSVASPVIFDEIIGHKGQSHVNLDLSFPPQITPFVTQTSLYLPKDRLHINLALCENLTALRR